MSFLKISANPGEWHDEAFNPDFAILRKTAKNDFIQQVKIAAKKLFDSAQASHDWDHTLRVHKLCVKIGEKEGADMDVLETAAYLHDIGRSHQDKAKGTICHAKKGAELAKDLIRNLPVSEIQKGNIIHCILSHRFRGGNFPQTNEAKILFDADKIDAIGAVGVARAFLFAGEVGARLHNSEANIETTKPYSVEDTGYREYIIKLSKIKDRMLTPEGKKIADKRHKFMESFFKRFLKELEGII